AQQRCADLAVRVWGRRREYLPELVSVEEGVQAALAEKEGLVVLSDSADSTTSGAPGDSTHILRELLRHDWPRPALVTLVDPELVVEASHRGVRAEFTTALGAKRDRRFSQPVMTTVRVVRLFDARFVMSGHLAKNMAIDMGPSVLLLIGNVHVV